jgi:hypothetical protein
MQQQRPYVLVVEIFLKGEEHVALEEKPGKSCRQKLNPNFYELK